jgi:hypothetical protein
MRIDRLAVWARACPAADRHVRRELGAAAEGNSASIRLDLAKLRLPARLAVGEPLVVVRELQVKRRTVGGKLRAALLTLHGDRLDAPDFHSTKVHPADRGRQCPKRLVYSLVISPLMTARTSRNLSSTGKTEERATGSSLHEEPDTNPCQNS